MYLYKYTIKSKQTRIFKKLSRDWSLLQKVRKQGIIFWHDWDIFKSLIPTLKCKSAEGHAIMGMRQCEHPNIFFEGNTFTVEKIAYWTIMAKNGELLSVNIYNPGSWYSSSASASLPLLTTSSLFVSQHVSKKLSTILTPEIHIVLRNE